METHIAEYHHKRAFYAFQKAIQLAEARLMKESPTDGIEEAKIMVDLAELHLLAHDMGKAETEFTKALNTFYRYPRKDEKSHYAYIVYLLKTLSGIHECQGRRNEAKTELSNAMKWEEMLRGFH